MQVFYDFYFLSFFCLTSKSRSWFMRSILLNLIIFGDELLEEISWFWKKLLCDCDNVVFSEIYVDRVDLPVIAT